jgi:hypothetical protein
MSQLNVSIGQLVNELQPYQLQCTVDNAGVAFNSFIHLF